MEFDNRINNVDGRTCPCAFVISVCCCLTTTYHERKCTFIMWSIEWEICSIFYALKLNFTLNSQKRTFEMVKYSHSESPSADPFILNSSAGKARRENSNKQQSKQLDCCRSRGFEGGGVTSWEPDVNRSLRLICMQDVTYKWLPMSQSPWRCYRDARKSIGKCRLQNGLSKAAGFSFDPTLTFPNVSEINFPPLYILLLLLLGDFSPNFLFSFLFQFTPS